MKKLLTILCVCVLVLVCVFTLPTKAEAATNPNDFRYTFYYKEDGYASDYVAITGYAGIGGEITIPDAIYGYPVTEIADRAFFDDCTITCVTIPEGVTKIGTSAFQGCLRLEQVNLPDTLKIIGQDGFAGCENLKTIDLPDGLTTISGWAFDGCSNLQSITIPDSVTLVDSFAFRACKSLKTVTLPQGITEIPNCLFFGCDSLQGITIPESVTSIGEYAFYSCDRLQTISIPDGVSKIEKYTFGLCCRLVEITLPGSIDLIKDKAFYQCSALSTVYYGGTESQWNQIYIKQNNEPLTAAKRLYLAIARQPKNASAAMGKTVKVTVKAAGDGLTYRWYYKDKGASKFTLTTAFTGNTYSVKMTAARSGRQLYCVITNKYGNTLTTQTVTIRAKATITKQPKSVAVAKDATAKVTVQATGEGLTYKWYFKNKGANKFSLTKSFTGTSYSIKMDASRSGRQVYCVITDKYGNTVTTKTVTLSVKATITAQPKSVTVSGGKTAKITVGAAGEGLTYKWYYKNKGATKFSLSSVKTSAYSTKMSTAVNGRQVYCVVKDKFGNTVKTNTVTLKRK